MVYIEKRQADRLQVMREIFEMSDGSQDKEVDGTDLSARLGLDPQEIGDACHYLMGEGLIEEAGPSMGASPVPYWVNITHQGIREMEQSFRSPSEPTHHFPPLISVVHIQGDVISSAIQSGSPGAEQQVSLGDLDLEAVREFLRELDARATHLELSPPDADELAAEVATVKAQVESPRPKHQIVRACLISIREILQHATGGVTAGEPLPLLQHLRL